MSYSDVRAFLLHLATEETIAASTQNQALNTLLFLYREVLEKDLDAPIETLRAKSAKRVPTVLTQQETLAVIERLSLRTAPSVVWAGRPRPYDDRWYD